MSLTIGNVKLNSNIVFAPIAGFSEVGFRHLCAKFGAGLTYTELVSAKGLVFGNKGTEELIATTPIQTPCAVQLFGSDPEFMYKASKDDRLKKFDIIDINMGCPVNKVVKGTDGCALMRHVELAQEIVRTVKSNITIPLSVKFGLGYTFDELNYVEYGQKMQEAGADFITIHGRTRSQMYGGKADWKKIAELKRNVDIPVFANGDVVSIETAVQCLEESQADGVAIGRGCLGDPSLLYRVEKYLNSGEYIAPPTLEEKILTLKKHLNKEVEFRGENIGVKFCRKFYPYYVNGFTGASRLRGELVLMDNLEEIFQKLDKILCL